ncbi:unnamed protein product [Sordaria macrospora k-hell]|uniref:WGS project CABT00000000 data, contig 2.31 n=2 Tax=Sordaria macrospora TaxID=5147 RepID=F7W5P7_SORMK|nr:uncharacterized protein SMAC_09030 [Sordaria macrospora k-hell]CCC12835.1 unnamed protein product [Sordaria macrospora k-hell]
MEFTVYVEGCLEEELDEENPSTIPVPCETAPLVYTNQKAEVTKEEREYTKEEHDIFEKLQLDEGGGQ